MTGDLTGSVCAVPRQIALDMVKIMSGMEMDKLDGFVTSALANGNIISGNAVTNLGIN